MTAFVALERSVSKAAAVGLLLGVIWFIGAILVEPLTARLSDAEDQIAQERLLLGRLLMEARGLSARPAEDASGEPALLPGDTEAEKIAGLQSRVETVAASAGVLLSSVQPMAERSEGRLRLIGLRAIASGSIDDVQQFFHEIELGRPVLIIQSLDITPTARGPEVNGLLDMRISIMGAVASSAPVQP
jgi:hypothetical protein